MTEPRILENGILNTPEQLVKFNVFKQEHGDEADIDDCSLTGTKDQPNKLSIRVRAKWIVESILIDYNYFHIARADAFTSPLFLA